MKQWLPAIVALIVGAGFGFFLGYLQRPQNAPSAAHEPSTATNSPATAPAANTASPPTSSDKGELSESPEAAPSYTFDIPAAPTGEGVATGRLRLADGTPCPDFMLRAIPSLPPPLSQTKVLQMPLQERVAYEEAVLRRQFDAAREATTDANGAFKFGDLSTSYYTVAAAKAGWKVRKAKGHPQAPASFTAGDELDLIATNLRTVPLRVLLPDGNEIGNAQVVATSAPSGSSEYTSWTPTRRGVDVTPGTVKFRVSGVPDDSLIAEVTAEIATDGQAEEIQVQLARTPGVYITLNVPEPYYAELGVSLLPAENLLHHDSRADPWVNRDGKTYRKLGPNRWLFAAVPPGDYVFFVGVQHIMTLMQERITVAEGVVEFTFDLPALDTRDHVTVRVVGEDGKPLSRARLSCTLDDSEVVLGDMTAYLEVESGVYMMRRPQARVENRFIPFEGRDIVVQAAHGGSKRFGRLPALGSEVEIRFDSACTLVVEIANLPELGRNDMWVAVVPSAASIRRESNMARYGDGSFGPGSRRALMASQEFKDLQAGKATVLVMRTADRPLAAITRQEVTLGPGVQTVTVTMPALYELVVRTKPEQKVRGCSVLGNGLELSAQADGQVIRILGLPAGEYWVGNYTGYMRVSLPAPDGVDFSPSPSNCLYLYAYDNKGILHTKGMRLGDLVVSISGETAEGYEVLKAKWESAATLPSVMLEIDRAGMILTVTLTGAELATAIQDGARVNYRRR